jgi:polyphosphate kinase 2 (PPK2 family)
MGYCSHEEYEKFMDDVVPFEERLNKKGIHIIKLWFSVTKETQELRFKMRQANPLKYWKFSENDLKTMNKWEQFTAYKERMFNETSTLENPWIVVDSDDKRLAQLNVMRYILNQVNYKGKDMDVIGQPYPEIIIPMI